MLNKPDADHRDTPPADERWKTAARRLGAGGVILALAIVGLAGYTYPLSRRQSATMKQITGQQNAVDRLTNRMKAAESEFSSWAKERQARRDEVAELRQHLTAQIDTLRNDARRSSAEMFHHLQAQIAGQIQGMQSRLARLESSSDGTNARIAELQREMGQAKSVMTQQANEINVIRTQMRENAVNRDRQMAGLKRSEDRDQRDIDAVNNKLAVRRVDFEVAKNRSQQLAPGISLHVTGTDVGYRRVTGWMWVMPDRRTIWLRGQAAQEPVIFYGYKDGKKRELVVTNVSKNEVTGYLVLPGSAGPNAVAAVRPTNTSRP